MCGVLGVVSPAVSDRSFEAALTSMEHRGPNAAGIKKFPNKNLFLGHRRLSILDLSDDAVQPMVSSCGNYVIVFNGEIYNFNSLKKLLSERYREVKSDTRILVELISRLGVKNTLLKLDGMFAFAVYDIKLDKLMIARDPFGEKPLYFYQSHKNLAFSSELKPIIGLFKEKLTLNSAAISGFLKYNYVPKNLSIFNEVVQLSPGCFAEISLNNVGKLSEESYWQPSQSEDKEELSFFEATAEFSDLFNQSVSRRCISDVPLGAFLSGGYDSSAVVASMVETGVREVKTFSVGFEEQSFNEAPFAKKIAEHLNTDHTELYVPSKKAFEIIPRMAEIYDEPFADVSQIPTFLLSQLTKQHVTVALSGDGGDELLGGYSRYTLGVSLWKRIRFLPYPLRALFSSLVTNQTVAIGELVNRGLPEYRRIKNLSERSHKISRILSSNSRKEFYDNLTVHDVPPNELLNIEVSDNPRPTEIFDGDFVAAMMKSDLRNYLPGDILTKVDRASMANSLEVRTPFLSRDLYQFSQKIPFEFLYKGTEGKIILKDYVHKRVPKELVDRPKMGFGVPISQWLRSDLKSWVNDVLNEEDIKKRGVFCSKAVRRLVEDHNEGNGNKHNTLWSVLILSQWLQEYDFAV